MTAIPIHDSIKETTISTQVLSRTRLLAASLAMLAAAQAHAQLDTGACLARLRPAAPANGIQVADFDTYTQGATLLASTVASARAQPEGKETWWDYLAKTVDEERVADGRKLMQAEAAPLSCAFFHSSRRRMVSPMVLFNTLALLPCCSSFLMPLVTVLKAAPTDELTAPPMTSPNDSLFAMTPP